MTIKKDIAELLTNKAILNSENGFVNIRNIKIYASLVHELPIHYVV